MSERIARIREKLKQIVCTEGDDRGVVLLSQESPTYYDEHLKAHVYKHLHFSPLGDALIELWDIVEAEPGWGDWRSVKESGWYWWWNQDLDSAPVPVSILHDGHGLYFASKGQLGWTRAQNVEEMVGLWMPVTEPEVPRELAGTGKDAGSADYLRRDNVWLGTSVSDQATADALVPELLKCRDLSPVLFLSVEPLLGPINMGRAFPCGYYCDETLGHVDHPFLSEVRVPIDWIIVGGESGPQARRCETAWAYTLIDQCQAAGVSCFVKQLGSNAWSGGLPLELRDKKGGNWDEWPDGLRVRQMPEVPHA